jgi:hypothetical protein
MKPPSLLGPLAFAFKVPLLPGGPAVNVIGTVIPAPGPSGTLAEYGVHVAPEPLHVPVTA